MAELHTIARGPQGTVLVNSDRIECVFIRPGKQEETWTAEIHLTTGKVIATGEWTDRYSLIAMIKHGLDTETPDTPDATIGG